MKSTLPHIAIAACLLAIGPSYAGSGHPVRGAEPLDIEMFYQFSATDEDAEAALTLRRATPWRPDRQNSTIVAPSPPSPR